MLPWIDAQENGSEDVMWIQIWGFRRSIRIMTESIWRYSGSGNIFFFFSFFCLVPSLLYPAFIIGPHRYPMAGGGHGGQAVAPPPQKKTGRASFWCWCLFCVLLHSLAQIDFLRLVGGMGGRAQRLPPKEHRKNSVLALSVSFRFFSFVPCYCCSRCCSSFFLFLCLVSSVLYCALNITPHKFPKAGGGHGGEGAAPPPPKNTGRTAFWLWSVSFRFFSFVPCYCCSRCCSSFFFLFLCLVSSVLYCALNITPHKFPKAGGGHGGEGAAPPPPKNTGRTAFWLWSVSFRFFSFVPCYCSRCCSSFFFLFLCLVSSVLCCALSITPHKFPKAGGGHEGEGAAPPPQRTQEEQRSGFDPFRFASFPLCLVIVVLVVVLLLLVLVSGVVCLVLCLKHCPT